MTHTRTDTSKRQAPARPFPPRRWLELAASPAVLCLVAVGLALALYWRTLGFEFIDLDDTVNVLGNPHVLGGLTWANVRWAFADLAGVVDYWHPVSQLSLMLDASLYGQWAGGYHATNFLLHAANVALVFLLVRTVTTDKWSAFAVAAFFAVHPLHLESVAWITERKDVLFMFWGLLALNSYLAWARSRSRSALTAFYCCYALSLMSKPVLVVLPGILLLLDYWPLGRFSPYELLAPSGPAGSGPAFGARLRTFWPLLREKLPMVGLAALSTLMTVLSSLKRYDLVVVDAPTRFGNAFLSLAKYAGKLFVPTNLAILYPFQTPLPFWPLVLSMAGFCAVLVLVLWRGRRFPWLILGLGWVFLGLLTTIVVPKAGVQVPLADRFTYFPFVGAYLVLALGARELAARLIADSRKRHLALAACFLALLGWYWVQADNALGFWRNKFTIYERAIDVTPGNHILFNNYARVLLDRQDFSRAETYALKALALQPDYNFALGNLGNVYAATGRYEQAIEMFQRALAQDRNDEYSADDHYSIGYCLAQLHRYDEAEKHYHEALAIRPNYPLPYNDLGNIAVLRGDLRHAEEYYAKTAALLPDSSLARENLRRVQRLRTGGGQ